MALSSCVLDETFSALTEIEEKLISRRTELWRWGPDNGPKSVIDTLYGLGFTISLRETVDSTALQTAIEVKSVAELNIKSNREFYIPYVLGLVAQATLDPVHSDTVMDSLETLLESLISEKTRAEYVVDLLFGAALFCNLVKANSSGKTSPLRSWTAHRALSIAENFKSIELAGSRIKLLYVLASFPDCFSRIKELYLNFRKDIEDLRHLAGSLDERIILLKPYATLNVECHQSLIEEAMTPIRRKDRAIAERALLHRVSKYFLYRGLVESGVAVSDDPQSGIRLTINVNEGELKGLETPEPGMAYICMVGLILLTSGYSRVYLVSAHERYEYFEFKKSQEADAFSRVERKGLETHIEQWVSIQYWRKIAIGLTTLLATLVGALYFWLNSAEFLSGQLPSATLFAIFFYFHVYKALAREFSQSSKSFFHLILRRKGHKECMRDELITSLGIGEDMGIGSHY